jgi:hypothetical protein
VVQEKVVVDKKEIKNLNKEPVKTSKEEKSCCSGRKTKQTKLLQKSYYNQYQNCRELN